MLVFVYLARLQSKGGFAYSQPLRKLPWRYHVFEPV